MTMHEPATAGGRGLVHVIEFVLQAFGNVVAVPKRQLPIQVQL